MKNYNYISLLVMLLFSLSVKAGMVIDGNVVSLTTGVQAQTSDGQEFTFLFDELPVADGNDGELIIQARGDYSKGHDDQEYIQVDIDGFSAGKFGATQSNVLTEFNFEDNEWKSSTSVSGILLSQFWTNDGQINLLVALSPDVELNLSQHQSSGNYVFDPYIDVTLRYTTAVPIPMGIVLFATSLISLIGVRRSNIKAV